ncbi:MAG: alpha/beta hydrolase [Rhodanobacter sp.]
MNLSQPQFVDTSRGRFAWREGGQADGSPLVMLHGWPESSYCWEHLAGYLRPGLRIIAPDLRGLGDSERTAGLAHYLKVELAGDVVAALDALGVGDFQLVGHDWGGCVAQEVALALPLRVRRLILMNIAVINNVEGNREVARAMRESGGAQYWYQHFQQAPGLAEAMIPGAEEVWLRYFLRTSSGSEFPADAIEEYVRCYRIEGTPGSGANYYRAFRADAKRWATLAGHRWSMPSLYIYGNKDPVIIPEYLNHIDECFRDLQVIQVEAGHFLQEELPAEVAAHMNGFLRITDH